MPSNYNGENRLKKKPLQFELSNYIVYIAFIVIFIFFSLTLNNFFTFVNLLNIVKQSAMIAIMAFAMTFVIGAGQIDLSIGSLAAVSSLTVSLMLRATDSIFLSVIVTLALGAAVGLINGAIMNGTGLPAFLVTMGTQIILRGVAMWMTNTAAVPVTNQVFITVFGGSNVPHVPVLIIWIVVFMLLMYFLMNKTTFGRKVLAVGGNEQAAIYSGIKTKQTKLKVMLLSGVMAAVAGMLFAGRLQVGRHTYAEGAEMFVIASTVLGGTSMNGGTAKIFGAAVGAILMGMLDNGVVLAGFSVSQQLVVRGVVLILATALGSFNRRNKE